MTDRQTRWVFIPAWFFALAVVCTGGRPQGAVAAVVREVGIPEVTEPSMPEGKLVVKLPAEASDVSAAGGGRYLVIHMKGLESLGIFDVSQARLVKILSVPPGEIHFACGLTKLFVASVRDNSITRYSLETFAGEVKVSAPDGGVQWMGMGSASTEPLVVASGRESLLFDPQTMRHSTVTWRHFSEEHSNFPAPQMRVSEDGRSILAWGGGWAGVERASVDGQKVLDRHEGRSAHAGRNAPRISYDGNYIFTSDGVLDGECKPASAQVQGFGFGTQSPHYVLSLKSDRRGRPDDKDPELRFYIAGANTMIWRINDMPELVNSALPPEERIWFIPSANVLAFLGSGSREIVLRRFNILDTLNKAGVDYLFVSSTPVQTVRPGSRYIYQIRTESKRGEVKYDLQSAPDGMKVSSDGRIEWPVPAGEPRDARVIVSITDASGQQVFHSFTIHVTNLAPPEDPVKAKPRNKVNTPTKA